MPKLTDTQLLILSKASQRADHAVILPETLNRVTAGKVVASLMKRQLLAEIQAGPYMPVWRTDPAGNRFALVITEAGLQALGVTDDTGLVDDAPATNEALDGPDAPIPATAELLKPQNSSPAVAEGDGAPARSQGAAGGPKPPRPDSKLGTVLVLLQRPDGATLDDLEQATGWLPHTTRAALTGLRQRGYAVDTVREQGRPTVYRVAAAAGCAAPDAAVEQG
jgi:hypothetical protein